MTYDVQICIISPITCKATKQSCIINLDYIPDYEDIVKEFYRQWDKPDKYDVCYAVGVESMKLHDNKN